ncbi:hypothetical protein PBF_24608 [Cytobacillus firmus DS1]|uniref:Uncharacterized protein n=1 Tax=Cytobacillus firmus DS1 TaxID=1307436 RepID=W7L990_CYTFI|nr:hypothetical protein PBF_24608 [Cytobacillus firmus DS1]
MNVLLNALSMIGSFFVVFSLLYFIQSYTLGYLSIFRKEVKGKISIGDIVFPLISLTFIILFIDFYRPY